VTLLELFEHLHTQTHTQKHRHTHISLNMLFLYKPKPVSPEPLSFCLIFKYFFATIKSVWLIIF